MYKLGLLLGILLLFTWLASPVLSQVNIEKYRRDEERPGFSWSIKLDLSVRSGNVDEIDIDIGGRGDYVRETSTTFVLTRLELDWREGQRKSNEALVHLRHVYRLRSWLRPEAFVQYDYDKRRLLTFRGLIGTGLRFRLYQTQRVHFWWGSTYMLEHERLDVEEGAVDPKTVSVHRWSNYLTSKVHFNEGVRLLWTIYAQPRFDKLEDIRILGEVSLGVGLGSALSLVITFRMLYDNLPPSGVDPLDTALKTGLAIEF